MTALALPGCSHTILAGHLKALAIHRLVAAQVDPEARSYWDEDGVFHLETPLDAEALVDFFLRRYEPTPIVTPWNGGSGFYTKDQKAGIDAIAASEAPRFAAYRGAIAECRALLAEMGLHEKPADDFKLDLLLACRARVSDEALAWLDAAFVVGDAARYPALLGTGGNDGRLEFANNFMQRLAELLAAPGKRTEERLRAALFGTITAASVERVSVGQFTPVLAGGTNMTNGPSGGSRINPWDYVLMVEGAIVFAGTSVRRLEAVETPGASFPFHVRATSAGYSSASESEAGTARSELWIPRWTRPATFRELEHLFAEGRLELGGRRAANGLEAIQALAALGVDRGFSCFERFAIQKRNGLSFLACWQGTERVREVTQTELLEELRDPLRRIERLSRSGDLTAGASSAFRRLRESIFEVGRHGGPLTDTLAALGAFEREASRSRRLREEIAPIRTLRADWIEHLDDSPEVELALAFSSWDIRREIEPIDDRHRFTDGPPRSGDPVALLLELVRRRLTRGESWEGRRYVGPDSLSALLESKFDRSRLLDLLYGAVLLSPSASRKTEPGAPVLLPAAFAVLRTACSPRILAALRGPTVRRPGADTGHVPRLLALVGSGRVAEATDVATRRLTAMGATPPFLLRACPDPPDARTWALGLLVPLSGSDEDRLAVQTLRNFTFETKEDGHDRPVTV